MHGFWINGATGLAVYLTEAERRDIVEVAARHIAGRVPFWVHVGSYIRDEACRLAEHARECGAVGTYGFLKYFGFGFGNPRTPMKTLSPEEMGQLRELTLKVIKPDPFDQGRLIRSRDFLNAPWRQDGKPASSEMLEVPQQLSHPIFSPLKLTLGGKL